MSKQMFNVMLVPCHLPKHPNPRDSACDYGVQKLLWTCGLQAVQKQQSSRCMDNCWRHDQGHTCLKKTACTFVHRAGDV